MGSKRDLHKKEENTYKMPPYSKANIMSFSEVEATSRQSGDSATESDYRDE
jgi:hypothetical protein